ncbi:MAG: hypothetical protein ACP5JR_03635 [Thermoplasmata archaeon]
MATQPPSFVPPPQQPMQPIPPAPSARPTPSYPPVQTLPPPPKEEIPSFVSNKLLVIFVFFGMVMLALGAMMLHAAPEITNRDYSIYNAQDQEKIREADQRLKTTVTDVGHILADIGALLLVTFLLLAALLRTDWSDTVRFGLFLAVGLFLLGFAFTI